MKINRQSIESLNPCKDRLENYLTHYADWEGTWLEFFELDKITTSDKLWVFFREIPEIERQQREFAFLCASRSVEDCDVVEVKEYFTLILFIYESEMLDLLDSDDYSAASWAADSAAYMAAYRAAYRAAYMAAEREVQLEIVKYVMGGAQ